MKAPMWIMASTVALSSLPLEAQVQGAGLSVGALACRARDAVIYLRSKEITAGWCAGLVAALKLGPLVLEGSGFRAKRLEPIEETALTRDGGEVRALVGLAFVPWFVLEGGTTVRAFSSAAGYQRWQITSGGIKIATPLGDPALTAYLRGHYLPPVSQEIPAGQVSGKAKWDFGILAEGGLRIAPRKAPLFLGATYRLERYDFPRGAAGRLEQFELVSVYGGLRVGR